MHFYFSVILQRRPLDCPFLRSCNSGREARAVARRCALVRHGILCHFRIPRGVPFPRRTRRQWLFRITEARWTEASRNATRKLVLAVGLIPLLLLTVPWEIVSADFVGWNWLTVKVPFTCSYFSGTKSLAFLGVLYIYGVTGYSFDMADLESAMESHWAVAVLFFVASAVALILAWRRNPTAGGVRFDGREPVIQTLELS